MHYFLTFILLFNFSQALAHDGHVAASDLAISTAFDPMGNLWRVQVKDDFVEVAMSRDLGKHFSPPVRVNATPQTIRPMGESRPKIAIGPTGAIYVTWMQNLKARFSSHLWFARSLDAGKTFEAPYILHQDRAEIGHAFEELKVAPNGDITVLWLDGRDLAAAKSAGKQHDGSSIYYAVSTNQGKSFAPETKLTESSCECCRIAATVKPDGTVVAMWRHVFEGSERDHMMAEVPKDADSPTPKRATYGRWKIDGCPHHGPALASGGEGKNWWGYHMAWFDGGNDDAGKDATLFYGRMDGEAWVSSRPKKFGNMKNQAGHPAIASVGENVWLVWSEKEAEKTKIWLMKSDDGGKNWAAPSMLADVKGAADYPALIAHANHVYLVWNTTHAGLKVMPLQN